MCGRFAITLAPEVFREAYAYADQPNFPPRYNVAPTQPVPIVTQEEGARRFKLVRWGFLPGWVKDPKDFPLVINARAETLLEKPTFKAAIRRRRCMFLADAFYEWRREGNAKMPFAIRMNDGGPMPLAGLWETYSDPQGGEIDTAAIVTTGANGTLAAIHHRMPVILPREEIASWLDCAQVDEKAARAMARPCADERIVLYPVSTRVNRVANDGPENLEPASHDEPARRPAASDDGQGSLF